VQEVVTELCKLQFDGHEAVIKANLSFWYLTEIDHEWPLVADFLSPRSRLNPQKALWSNT
jgi:hypothetical protein